MKVSQTDLPDVILLEPAVFSDERGKFLELWNAQRAQDAGFVFEFCQDNLSYSSGGCLRGLHFQYPTQQGKLITAISGRIFDVAVDIRRGSPTFGKWTGVILDDEANRQLWIPKGYAHGFLVLSEQAAVMYKVDAPYCFDDEHIIAHDDPDIGIDWPTDVKSINSRDRDAPRLNEITTLPSYPGVEA